jgi:hypothetical protein
MIKELIEDVARQLVVLNASWLSEVRTIGYVQSTTEGKVITDQLNEIGITDVRGNSGYIRFQTDQNFTREEITRRTTSCNFTSSKYTYRLRLIVVATTETPEDLSLLLSTQINSFAYTGNNVRTRVTGGGSHSANIVKEEGGSDWNPNYRAIYVDFTLSFDWRNDCDQIAIKMNCDNCTSTYDLGCIQHCKEVELETVATYTGVATLNTQFNGIVVTQSFDVTEGDPITVPMDGLNENYEYNIQLRDEDGEIIELTFGSPSENYDCFKIKTQP